MKLRFEIKALAVALSLLMTIATPAGSQSIDFPKYAVPVYVGVRAQPNFAGDGARFAKMRTRIREGFAANAIAAGHYTVIQIGCGSSCTLNLIGDVRSGHIVEFPVGREEYPGVQIITDPKSRLFTAKWGNIAFTTCRTRLYSFDGLRFTQIGKDEFQNKSCFD
ncbi:hypothetical protein [Sphingomonas sp. PAMC 26617]|uniref:hypothetical protein n=1 Tax=Sphingomonas sp. PAMC 26617 TaxID=1112216 RepID=UPI001E59DB0A|nr:hypothetical protein [Sphingomonas sp. PAMC 26617]